MRCESCVLLQPAPAAAPGPRTGPGTEKDATKELGPVRAVLRAVLDCDECPLAHGAGAAAETVAALVGHLRRAAELGRQQEMQLKKCRNEARELRELAKRSEERVIKLEELQRASSRESEAELKAKMDLVSQKEAAIAALSTPIIAVHEGVLVLPLIGTLDDLRAANLTQSLLDEIQASRAQHAIVDLTGVPALDLQGARHLLRLAQAVRLLGAQVLLCGLRPQVAQALVGVDVELGSLRTARSLQEALRYFQHSQAGGSRSG